MKPMLLLEGILALLLAVPPSIPDETPPEGLKTESELPSRYPYVVADMRKHCQPEPGVWVDLGAGNGGVAMAMLETSSDNPILMLDPDADAMTRALRAAREKGLQDRLSAVVGVAEDLPFPDDSVDLIVSRGSIFFWDDPVEGLREVYRVLRPGAKAMIGGGAGSGYPDWATDALIKRRLEMLRGEESERWKRFVALRCPEQMREWAEGAKLPDFTVSGQGAVTKDPQFGQGVWLTLQKWPEIAAKHEADRVTREQHGDTTIYDVTSPGGIGAATITTGDAWPDRIAVRLHLRGLESFAVSTDRVTLNISVLSHGENQRLLRSLVDGREAEVGPGSPLWTEVLVRDKADKVCEAMPGEGGYFEIILPTGLFDGQPRSLQLKWIDFYR